MPDGRNLKRDRRSILALNLFSSESTESGNNRVRIHLAGTSTVDAVPSLSRRFRFELGLFVTNRQAESHSTRHTRVVRLSFITIKRNREPDAGWMYNSMVLINSYP